MKSGCRLCAPVARVNDQRHSIRDLAASIQPTVGNSLSAVVVRCPGFFFASELAFAGFFDATFLVVAETLAFVVVLGIDDGVTVHDASVISAAATKLGNILALVPRSVPSLRLLEPQIPGY